VLSARIRGGPSARQPPRMPHTRSAQPKGVGGATHRIWVLYVAQSEGTRASACWAAAHSAVCQSVVVSPLPLPLFVCCSVRRSDDSGPACPSTSAPQSAARVGPRWAAKTSLSRHLPRPTVRCGRCTATWAVRAHVLPSLHVFTCLECILALTWARAGRAPAAVRSRGAASRPPCRAPPACWTHGERVCAGNEPTTAAGLGHAPRPSPLRGDSALHTTQTTAEQTRARGASNLPPNACVGDPPKPHPASP
jgi:hypothetical protein